MKKNDLAQNVNEAKVEKCWSNTHTKTNETSTFKYNIVNHSRLTLPLEQLQQEWTPQESEF